MPGIALYNDPVFNNLSYTSPNIRININCDQTVKQYSILPLSYRALSYSAFLDREAAWVTLVGSEVRHLSL